MAKWFALAGIAILLLLFLLWKQLDSTSATAAPKPKETETKVVTGPAPAPKQTEPVQVAVANPGDKPAVKKLDPQSDEFFHKHDDKVVARLMKEAVKCWENLSPTKQAEFNRNQSMVMKFKQRIRNGTVTINDVEVERSTIGDTALEACFVQHIRGATWHSEELPDWDQDDEIKLGPRTLKKYTKANIDHVGPPAPKHGTYIRGGEEP